MIHFSSCWMTAFEFCTAEATNSESIAVTEALKGCYECNRLEARRAGEIRALTDGLQQAYEEDCNALQRLNTLFLFRFFVSQDIRT